MDVTYLNFSKAFATYSLTLSLASELREYNFDKTIVRYMHKWLDHDTQIVTVNSLMSDWKDVSSGVA